MSGTSWPRQAWFRDLLTFVAVSCGLAAFVTVGALGDTSVRGAVAPGFSVAHPRGGGRHAPPARADRPPAHVPGTPGAAQGVPGRLGGPPLRVPHQTRPTYYVPASQRAVALTFDDGPDPRWTPQILDILRANHVHATFCMIGRQVAEFPALVRRIAAEGHRLCNHTWDHDEHLPRKPAAHVDQEVRSAHRAITTATGYQPRYFRAPGGNWSPTVLADAETLGMTPLAWNVDPRDWTRPGVAHIRAQLLSMRPGDIILCHDGGGNRSQTVAALAQALPLMRARGIRFTFP